MREKGENRDLLLVLVTCSLLFALNFVWLLWVRHASPGLLRSLQNSAELVLLKKLLLQPLPLFAIAAVWIYWIISFIRYPRTKENRAFSRPYIFALILCVPFGFLLFLVFMH
jgi:hypothetical protein